MAHLISVIRSKNTLSILLFILVIVAVLALGRMESKGSSKALTANQTAEGYLSNLR
jgi:Tfp pilus assembly protein PilX